MTETKRIRLLPAIIIVALQWLLRYALPVIDPNQFAIAVLSGLLGGLGIIIWWTFFSRAPKSERWIGFGIIVGLIVITHFFLDRTISTGNMGIMFSIYAFPLISLAVLLWAALSRSLSKSNRIMTLSVAMLLVCGAFVLLRSDGIDGQGKAFFNWRWSKSSEEAFLDKANLNVKGSTLDSTMLASQVLWSGFKGADRNNVIKNTQINTNWTTNQPKEIWGHKIGPACSSFAATESHFYTQEQIGEYEQVTCYDINSGKAIWAHQDSARFWDSHCGAGPRSTPTLHNGKVYTLGATGIFNVLDAANGNVIWTRNAQKDTGAEQIPWAFCGSPLIVNNLVVISVSGRIIAYDIQSGKPVWQNNEEASSYCSPQLFTIKGERQILFSNSNGLTSYKPEDGKILWKHAMDGEQILQPLLMPNEDIIVSKGNIGGLCRLQISKNGSDWKTEELWTSSKIKPNHNDFVVHNDCIYGYNGPFLVCVDAKTGERIWKGDKVLGFLLLLPEQDVILSLTEKGKIMMIEASPEKYTQLGSIHGITGRTWNHPVLAGNILLVRNDKEMAAFKL